MKSKALLFSSILVLAYLAFRINIQPISYLGYFGDDYTFANWANTITFKGFFQYLLAPNAMTLTYRPLGLVAYLLFGVNNMVLCHIAVALLHLCNVALLYAICKKLYNGTFALLTVIIYLPTFLFYEATHAVLNIIMQWSILFFLGSLLLFIHAAGQHFTASGTWKKKLSCLLYCMSLFTYESTLGGFVLYPLLYWYVVQYGETANRSEDFKLTPLRAVIESLPYFGITVFYLAVNFLSPIKSIHLQTDNVGIGAGGVVKIFNNTYAILKNVVSWILTHDMVHSISSLNGVELAILGTATAAVLFCLLTGLAQTSDYDRKSQNKLVFLMGIGCAWFSLILFPSVFSRYFPYRLTYFPLQGFALLVSAVATSLLSAAGRAGSRVLTAAKLLIMVILTVNVLTNYGMSNLQNQCLREKFAKEEQILDQLRNYLPRIPEESIIAVSVSEPMRKDVPNPYLAYPFSSGYALEQAVRYRLNRRIAAASTFFIPHRDGFTMGRLETEKFQGAYKDLTLFVFNNNVLKLQDAITVDGEQIALPRRDKINSL